MDASFENGWMVPDHDYQSHTGSTADHGPTEVIYKKGGVAGKIVATETISYDGFNRVLSRGIVWADDIYL
jgi:hypothetical protein